MRAGAMDRRVRIETKVEGVDPEYGTPSAEWQLVGETWASILDLLPSRGEAATMGLDVGSRPARVRMRYREGITSAMRLVTVDRARTANRTMQIITQPAELGRRDAIEFVVQDFTSPGNS